MRVCLQEKGGANLNWKDLAKYFVHGIAFSLLFLILGIVWVFVLAVLTALGSIIGFIIGFVLLFLIVGFLNSSITLYLWFEVESSFGILCLHGFALTIILLILDIIIVTSASLAFSEIATRAVTFIISTFLYGFVGKKVAGLWRVRET